MKRNTIQTIILALVGFAILFVGFLFLCSVCGEPTPEYDARLREWFGAFDWLAALFDNLFRALVGVALVWIGYKIDPFHDDDKKSADIPDDESSISETITPICNE